MENEFNVQGRIAETLRSLVKKAIHKNTGRVYAVKCPKERPQARGYWQRYANEMDIIDHLNHPSICQRLKSESTIFIEGHDMMCKKFMFYDISLIELRIFVHRPGFGICGRWKSTESDYRAERPPYVFVWLLCPYF